jgi:hypothetical protein
LDGDANVICGWLDADETVDEMAHHRFQVVFADQKSLEHDCDNYSVFDGGGGFTVGACGQIRPEPSDP